MDIGILVVLIGLVLSPLATFFADQTLAAVRLAAAILSVVSLAALAFLALTFDRADGLSLSWTFCGSLVAIGVAIAASVFVHHRSWSALGAGAAFVAGILVLHFCDLTPAKPYRRLRAVLREGMTASEVRAAARREYPREGRYAGPDVLAENVPALGEGKMILSDGLELRFRDGRVSATNAHYEPEVFEVVILHLLRIVAVASVYLCFRQWRKARRYPQRIWWMGHGIEASTAAGRVQRLRADFLGEHPIRRGTDHGRRRLLTSARQAVGCSAYFRSRAAQRPEEREWRA